MGRKNTPRLPTAAESAACAFMNGRVLRSRLKSKTVRPGLVEVNLEVRLKDGATDFVCGLSQLPGVRSAALVSYNGDYMG